MDVPPSEISCNFCGKNDYRVLSHEGSEGLTITTVMCKCCGLIYINPRMPKDWYNKYYQDEYRVKTITHDKGIGFDFENLFKKSKSHGAALGKLFRRVAGNADGLWMENRLKRGRSARGIQRRARC